jgi:EF-P beta-lysylation protein EpmB
VIALADSRNVQPLRLRAQEDWREQLRDAIRAPAELAALLGLSLQELGYSSGADTDFPLLVPRAFAARMRRGDASDPLLRQVLPAIAETQAAPGFGDDPVGEQALHGNERGVLRKYRGRALLITTGQCAVNCRYCFRRHYPYGDDAVSRSERLATVRRLAADPELRELILSGGDPLLHSDRHIAEIAAALADCGQPRTLRIHTRLPVVIPERVTPALLQALTRRGISAVVVLHANHPREIDGATAASIGALRDAGIMVLNQAVLLAGINDDAGVLAELSDVLFAAGALPYYLHLLDRVAGAAHFDLPEDRARCLVGEVAAMRPGYLVPRLVVEVPGASSKRELAPTYPERVIPD